MTRTLIYGLTPREFAKVKARAERFEADRRRRAVEPSTSHGRHGSGSDHTPAYRHHEPHEIGTRGRTVVEVKDPSGRPIMLAVEETVYRTPALRPAAHLPAQLDRYLVPLPLSARWRSPLVIAAEARASSEAQDRVWRRLPSLLFYWRHGTGPYSDVPMGLVLHADDPRRPRLIAQRTCYGCGKSIEHLRPQAKNCQNNNRCAMKAVRRRKKGLGPYPATGWTVERSSSATVRWLKKAPKVGDRDRLLTARQIKHRAQSSDEQERAA